jgi:mannose-6-phosphate isomerase-like protein (cupin superfamily)
MNFVHRKSDPLLTNVREQRTLQGVINGDSDLDSYAARQIKVITLHQNDFLGKKGHYHRYAELYCLLSGSVTFDLWDQGSDEKIRILLEKNDILLIPAGLVHRAYGSAGSVLLGSSSEAYSFDLPSDIIADFEPVGEVPYGL